MTEDHSRDDSSFAFKLNQLFETISAPGGNAYTNDEVAGAITEGGTPISGSYIWMLRKGQRDNPTLRHIEALAHFFGIPVSYFFDDELGREVERDLKLLAALKDAEVRRIALRSADLNERSLHIVTDIIDRVRELENKSEDDTDR
ncbi:helix-turn-helix domain-containing protein [Glycomyces arizonensis]|uniref:helix-turn-helix domain-containing protein n=1 Tax=Glycomyces arizonensis TaxID=256035 RepID=UPI000421224B|nr:helix-turn-helix domain-containing protein [Glycomyces arizonensis]